MLQSLLALLCCVMTAHLTQGLMFPLDISPESRTCTNNNDCNSGCCLLTTMSYKRPVEGICQPKGQFGQYCAPGNRLRELHGSKVYTYSCPCLPGLMCKPLWSRESYGMNVMQDPKCTPMDVNVHSPLISRFLYNSFPAVPAE